MRRHLCFCVQRFSYQLLYDSIENSEFRILPEGRILVNMLSISDDEFDKLISQVMDELPQEYIKGLENVVIVYEDEPTPEQRAETARLASLARWRKKGR